jgi:hypothetical protein
MSLAIEEYFKYHPPTTEERRKRHNAINLIAMEFAKVLDSSVVDEDCKKMALFAIQQARMFANQGITVDELKGETREMPQGKTLEQFFDNHAGVAIDYRLRLDYKADGRLGFYIHPLNVNGQTWDFEVSGNLVSCQNSSEF